jgi:hypothetical protein
MEAGTLVQTASLCVLLASAETLHGIARTVLVVPRIGKARALKWSIVTGTALAFAICWWRVPQVGLQGDAAHLALGGVLAGFMAAFDIATGLLVLRRPLAKVLPDFNPATGNYLLYGVIALALSPWVVARLQGLA